MGWDMINMTAYPEGYLARELELCYANISMVTDHDVGVEGAEPVTHETVMRVFTENNEKLRELLFAVIPKIGPQPEDVCATALRASNAAGCDDQRERLIDGAKLGASDVPAERLALWVYDSRLLDENAGFLAIQRDGRSEARGPALVEVGETRTVLRSRSCLAGR